MLILYLGTYELLVFSGGTVSPIPCMVKQSGFLSQLSLTLMQ